MINRSVYSSKCNKKCEKCSSQFPRAQSDAFRLLFSSNQQPKTQRLFIYRHESRRKVAKHYIQEADTSKCLTFLLEKGPKRCKIFLWNVEFMLYKEALKGKTQVKYKHQQIILEYSTSANVFSYFSPLLMGYLTKKQPCWVVLGFDWNQRGTM